MTRQGISQTKLRGMECLWGRTVRKHIFLIPFFSVDYRVRGFAGFSNEMEPIWYAGPPVSVVSKRLVFKNAFVETPPFIRETPADEFSNLYYLDHQGTVDAMFHRLGETVSEEGEREGAPARNIAGARIQGNWLQDVVFEPPLHRVRMFRVRHGWFRSRLMSVLTLPALTEMLSAHPSGGKPGKEGPYSHRAAKKENFIDRWLRKILEDQSPPKSRNS